jgi:hypothetical protein
MSMWEFNCSVAGYIKAHSEQKLKPPSPAEFYEKMRQLETLH